MAKISSVMTKSSGFKEPAVKYSNTQNNNSDANPHPNAATQNPATMCKDCHCEYMERPTTGIEKMGVGNMPANDAAREQMNCHPDAADLKDAGTMGTAGSMRRC
jgi:hypothetical protein